MERKGEAKIAVYNMSHVKVQFMGLCSSDRLESESWANARYEGLGDDSVQRCQG